MSKNIKISDIDNAKLLNGEINKNGINLCGDFADFVFDINEDYDRVIGILEVDDENKAILDSNGKPNFKVLINKDGLQYRSEDIVIPHYDDVYNDRLIDTVFPFSEIRKVMMKKYDEDDTVKHEFIDRVSEIKETLSAYRAEKEASPLEKFPDSYVEEVFKNVNTYDEGDESDSEIYSGWFENWELEGYEPSTYYPVVRIPLFYFRTYFDRSRSSAGKYYRCYEIISESVYNALPEQNKTGFAIPKAFYTQDSSHDLHKVLYVTSQPISRNGAFNCFGSENNIFEPRHLFGFAYMNSLTPGKYSYEAPDTIFNEYGMSAEIWYGVICYLMRLYTGSFDLCDIHPDSTTYDVLNPKFNKNIDFLNSDSTQVCTFEKVITSSNISDTESKILNISYNSLAFPLNCFYICTDSYFVTSDQDFYNKYSSDFELKNVTVTLVDTISDSSGDRYKYRIDNLSLSDGTYFVSNFFVNSTYGYVIEDKISIGNKCFIFTVSSGNITINNVIIYGYNDLSIGLVKYIYSENGSIFFETGMDSTYNVGVHFYLYTAYNNGIFTGAYKSNVLEFLFERIGVNGDLKKRAVVNAFIDTAQTSNAGHWQVIPITDSSSQKYAGLMLSQKEAIDYLKTEIFCNYNATTLGTDIIRISTYEHPWNSFGCGIEQNNRMLSCINRKNAYIGNKLTLMHFSDMFRPFKARASENLSYCLFNNRPSIYGNAPAKFTRKEFNRDDGDWSQMYYVTSNLVYLSSSQDDEEYFLFGIKIFSNDTEINLDSAVDYFGLKLEKYFDTTYNYLNRWILRDKDGNSYDMSNKLQLNSDFYIYIYQGQSTPPRLIIEAIDTHFDLTSYKTELMTSLQMDKLFVGSRHNEDSMSGVYINNMSCHFESGSKSLRITTHNFTDSSDASFDVASVATTNNVNKYFMLCDQEEIDDNDEHTYSRTWDDITKRDYYNSETSFLEIPSIGDTNDGTFFKHENKGSNVLGFSYDNVNNPINSEPDFIFSVGSITGSIYPMTYSPKPSLYSINMIELPVKNNYFKWFFRFGTRYQEFLDYNSYDGWYKYIYLYHQALMLTFLKDD